MHIRNGKEFYEHVTNSEGGVNYHHTVKKPLATSDGRDLMLVASIDVTRTHNLIESEQITNRALQQLSLESDYGKNLDMMADTLVKVIDCDNIALTKVENDALTFEKEWNKDKSFIGFEAVTGGVSKNLKSEIYGALRARQTIVISDVPASIKFRELAKFGMKSAIISPVFIESTFTGALFVSFSNTFRIFSDVDKSTLESMANIIAIAHLRKMQLDELNVANAEKQIILDNVKIPIWLYDNKANLIRVNSAVEKMAGVGRADLLSATCRSNFCKDTFVEKFCPVRNVIKTNMPASRDFRFKGREYMISAEPIFNEEGKLVNVVRSAVDVTEINELTRNEKILNSCLEKLASENIDADALNGVLTEIGNYLGSAHCYVMKYNFKTSIANVEYENSKPDGYISPNIVRSYTIIEGENWLNMLKNGEILNYPDVTSEIIARDFPS